jgi:Proteolysis_6 C-terminal
MPYAPPPPPSHPRFERLRRDVSSDVAVLATIYKILHMHCRESHRDDIVTLRTGRLAYDNEAKSEVCVARAVHLLTLGCFAWQNAKQDVYGWQERGGGSPGSVFFDREESPSVEKWVGAAFLTDPEVLMDCSWYQGEDNTLLLLRRLAVDGGAGGVFVVQDQAVQAGAAWLYEFAVAHSTEAAKQMGMTAGNKGEENAESELERLKQLAKEKALAKMNAQAAMFANMMNIDLNEADDDNDGTKAKSSEETDFERKKREARERALARTNNEAIKLASSAGIELCKGSEIQLEKQEESEFERRKREAKEKALARINGQAAKFAISVGLEAKNEGTEETEMEKRKRIAKEKAIARMNAQAAKFAAFADVELDNSNNDEGDQKVSATSGGSSSDTLRKEKPQCIICTDSDAECFVAFCQGSTVLKGGGPWSTSDKRMANVRRYVGAYVALCGHAMHSDCAASYLAKVQQKDDQGSGEHGEFRCPLCQRPSNCLVPFIDVGVNWIDSPLSSGKNLMENAGSTLHNLLATSPWWPRHNDDFVLGGLGTFIDKQHYQVEAANQAAGDVIVLKNLLEHIGGISYEADSKRLGSDNLHRDLGEFRHFITEKHYYDTNTECRGWPLCLLSKPVEDGVLRAFSREKFMAQLLTAIQSLTYSACCETFDARRHIDDKTSVLGGAEATGATASNELKQVLSKFGIAGALFEGQLILMPKPSSTEEGEQPFHGRFGRLRNFGVALMAAAGAFGPDLMQVVLQLPTSSSSVEETQGTPQRAPIAFPLLLGHVLTHIVAAISTTCGGNIDSSEWAKALGGKVGLSEANSEIRKPADRIALDCEGFLKLGFLARTIQALCKELDVGFEKSSEHWQFIHGLQKSAYSGSKTENDWIESCRVLLAAVGAPAVKESVPLPAHFKETFQSACLVAAGAGAAFLADAGTIVQILVPGIMARYEAGAVHDGGEEKIPSLRRLSMLRSLFKFEAVDKMLESPLVVEVIRKWYSDACAYAEKARQTPPGKQLLMAQSFRSWDWPLESARGYPGVALGPIKVPPKKSTPLLGGYNFDVQTGDNQRPRVDALTSSYMDLYAKIGVLKPDADRTAVCLVCGEALDASGVGECTKHSYVCGAGTGIFFLLQDCVGLIMHRGEGSFIHSIYVDSHGETPRGRPLYLDLARYDHLRDLWCGHGVRQRVLVERESTQQGVLAGFY